MKKIYLFLMMFLLGAGMVCAADLTALQANPTVDKDGTIQLNNAVCPVGEDKTDGKNPFLFKGVNYQLCCPMCAEKLKKHPERYALTDEQIQEIKAKANG